MKDIIPVEPTLDEDTLNYINGCVSDSEVTEKDVEEFIKYATKEDDKENYASFIAMVDRFDRSNPVFKRMTNLHIAAIKSDSTYRTLYREASDESSELSKMALARLEWNKQNIDGRKIKSL